MRSAVLIAALLIALAPAVAQQSPVGTTPETATGQVGQRQTRAQAAPSVDVTARIDSRVENRIDSRLRTRIDRNYDPDATAASAYAAAGDRVRAAGRARGR